MIINALRSFEAKYNITSFFRDLPALRDKTFTKKTIKHSFKNSGIWPVSFKKVKHKIKEYGKKSKKDTGLEFLEYGEEEVSSNSEVDDELDLVPDPQLEEEYQLPTLPPPALYTDCVFRFQELDSKIEAVLSSSPRRQYQSIRKSTDEFLMRGSLHELEVKNARAGQIATHKAKLNA